MPGGHTDQEVNDEKRMRGERERERGISVVTHRVGLHPSHPETLSDCAKAPPFSSTPPFRLYSSPILQHQHNVTTQHRVLTLSHIHSLIHTHLACPIWPVVSVMDILFLGDFHSPFMSASVRMCVFDCVFVCASR